MATVETDPTDPRTDQAEHPAMSPGEALRLAWLWWLVLLLIPFFAFIGVLWVLAFTEGTPRPAVAYGFFVASLLWMLITVPGAFVLRNYCFKAYWAGRTVEPRSYLRGMLTIWLAPEVGGILALLGVLLGRMWMPGLLPAAVAFMLFTPFWPTGRAMVEAVGSAEDDEVFRHPR